jgi:hypothetical protein
MVDISMYAKVVEKSPKDMRECLICGKIIDAMINHEDGTWRCPICNSQALEYTQINVKSFNRDEYPDFVESALVGLGLLAEKNVDPLLDIETGRVYEKGITYLVPMSWLMDLLQEVCFEAYLWYEGEFLDFSGYFMLKEEEVEELAPLTIMTSVDDLKTRFLLQSASIVPFMDQY